ncbi:Rossmann-like and DUF2520 domain-containing protein [Acinetobacter sp. WZC-1]|uniref:Rossmann-like and DUF2520 domain-containing protein n=1 Tax=Acinetobacter sp. WZC-1 TaxID=3459034 RepID=UPI00403DD869
MRISFIGSGRVATHLAGVLSGSHDIVQICSRDPVHAQKLARQVQAQAISDDQQLNPDIDVLMLAVSDQAIATVIQGLPISFRNILVVHTSGSTHLDVLTRHHQSSGVFYPLQTFSLERQVNWSDIPLLVEANHKEDLVLLTHLANSLSNHVYPYNSVQRLSLHLAAVFACNFSNYCYDVASQLTHAQQVDFSLLYPLMLETTHKAMQYDPKAMQTGPAVRGDQNILMLHQQLLADAQREDLIQIYELLSRGIMQRHLS